MLAKATLNFRFPSIAMSADARAAVFAYAAHDRRRIRARGTFARKFEMRGLSHISRPIRDSKAIARDKLAGIRDRRASLPPLPVSKLISLVISLERTCAAMLAFALVFDAPGMSLRAR